MLLLPEEAFNVGNSAEASSWRPPFFPRAELENMRAGVYSRAAFAIVPVRNAKQMKMDGGTRLLLRPGGCRGVGDINSVARLQEKVPN